MPRDGQPIQETSESFLQFGIQENEMMGGSCYDRITVAAPAKKSYRFINDVISTSGVHEQSPTKP